MYTLIYFWLSKMEVFCNFLVFPLFSLSLKDVFFNQKSFDASSFEGLANSVEK